MLVILSGMESVKKVALARELTMAFNNFNDYKIDGYSVDITTDLFTITDSEGKMVYGPGTNELLLNPEDGSYNEAGHQTFAKVQDFIQLVNTTIDSFVYKDSFGDIGYDYGVTQEMLFLEPYTEMLQKYNNRPFETVVLCGPVAAALVDKARTDLGADNVKVLSVIRNPSTSYLFTTISPSDVEFRHIDTSPISVKYATEEYIEGVLCSIKLKSLSGVQTVMFEDLIETKVLNFDGKTINLPEKFTRYNDFITLEEQKLIPELYTSDLDTLNEKLLSFQTGFTNTTQTLGSVFPNNIFAELGYEPLTLEQATEL